MKTRASIVAGAILAGLIVLGAALAAWHPWTDDEGVAMPAGQSLQVAQLERLAPLPGFALDRKGAPLTPAELRGRWTFFYFGYTNCPDACPATLGILDHVQETLRAQGKQPPRVVFVSLDPARDTAELLSRYVAAFGADTIGATGSDAALHDLLVYFGVTFERKDQGDRASYTIDHTAEFFLVTPDNRWLATFSPADDPDAVLQDTAVLLQMSLPRG